MPAEILQYPDVRLIQSVDDVTPQTNIPSALLDDMRYYLKVSGVAGLAAPQLGYNLRVIAVKYGMETLILVNPRITKASDKLFTSVEGCLSISKGTKAYTVKRNKYITVEAKDLQMNDVKYKARDMFGTALQHEIDHLNGILILNRL